MRSVTILLLLLSFFAYSTATSLQESLALVGGKYEHSLSYDEAKNSEGIKRQLTSENDDRWQFFYFCETGKNKKTCGSWVDAKGNKIKGANNNVKRTKDGAIISKLTVGDAGFYARVPEDKDENTAYLERVRLHVQAPPPPPPKY